MAGSEETTAEELETTQVPHLQDLVKVVSISKGHRAGSSRTRNAILGYPALAKFMAVTHHAYNLAKHPGSSGTIVIRGVVTDALYAVQVAYKAAAVASPADEDEDPLPRPPREEEAAFLSGEGRDKASAS